MQGQNSSPLWWKVLDQVTVEFTYILPPLAVPCASDFTRFRLFSISEPWYLLSAKQRWECLCHRICVWILLDILLLKYGRHIMHLAFLPRLIIGILFKVSPSNNLGMEVPSSCTWDWPFLSYCFMLLIHQGERWEKPSFMNWLLYADAWLSYLSYSWIKAKLWHLSRQWPQSFRPLRSSKLGRAKI